MKPQFTAGPWHENSGIVYPEDNTSRRSPDIAYIRGDEDSAEYKANARLIAAAPDLFSALQALLDCPDLNLDSLEPETAEAISNARAAISEASQ